MSWGPKLVQIFDVVLRIPPLFVMDTILNGTFLIHWIPDEPSAYSVHFFLWQLFLIGCFVAALIVFILPTKPILEIYSVEFAGLVLWFSYWFNHHFIVTELATANETEDTWSILRNNPSFIAVNAFVQLAMAFCYNSFRLEVAGAIPGQIRPMLERLRGGVYLCLLQPIICRLLVVPANVLSKLPLTCTFIVSTELLISVLIQLKPVIKWSRDVCKSAHEMLRNYGIQLFFETHWTRLHVPSVLRVFWIVRVTYLLTSLVTVAIVESHEAQSGVSVWDYEILVDIFTHVLVTGCETFTALLGMTSIVSYITHYIGMLTAFFIGSDNDDDKNMGTVSAILFFILALQTGLTGLEPERRIVRLYRNFCLLSTAILHFIHSMVNPLLMNLSASGNPSFSRHARPLIMCLALMLCPVGFLYYLWTSHALSTWLLAVTAFSVEVIIKVVITLLLYSLFMIDAYRNTFWEGLDDYVYYIKSTGNTIEFLFGIFLFCNGAWIMLFESGGTIRAIMMCIHAYFNIWVQAKEGWKVFMKRRTAVNKINLLPQATAAQLHAHNDVCAICYQELVTARLTYCNHLFHGVCLRKWLYVQDRCPICHSFVYKQENDADGIAAAGAGPVRLEVPPPPPRENPEFPPPNRPPPPIPQFMPLNLDGPPAGAGFPQPEIRINGEVAHEHLD